MNTKKFKKYRYLGNVYPEVPELWMPIILKMLKNIDKKVKPKFFPRFIINMLFDSSIYSLNSSLRDYWKMQLNTITGNVSITKIKQKFAKLKVKGSFNKDVQEIINDAITLSDNTCEYCGGKNTSHTIVKNWVRCICNECKENLKNNDNNI